MVDQLVTSDSIDPRRQEPSGIVRVTPRMHGDERFLNQVFSLFRFTAGSNELAAIIRTQMHAELRQQSPICSAVAAKTRDHQGSQRSLFWVLCFPQFVVRRLPVNEHAAPV